MGVLVSYKQNGVPELFVRPSIDPSEAAPPSATLAPTTATAPGSCWQLELAGSLTHSQSEQTPAPGSTMCVTMILCQIGVVGMRWPWYLKHAQVSRLLVWLRPLFLIKSLLPTQAETSMRCSKLSNQASPQITMTQRLCINDGCLALAEASTQLALTTSLTRISWLLYLFLVQHIRLAPSLLAKSHT